MSVLPSVYLVRRHSIDKRVALSERTVVSISWNIEREEEKIGMALADPSKLNLNARSGVGVGPRWWDLWGRTCEPLRERGPLPSVLIKWTLKRDALFSQKIEPGPTITKNHRIYRLYPSLILPSPTKKKNKIKRNQTRGKDHHDQKLLFYQTIYIYTVLAGRAGKERVFKISFRF